VLNITEPECSNANFTFQDRRINNTADYYNTAGSSRIEKIRSEPGPKYTELWTHLTEYQLRKFKATAEVDYKVLGLELSGAPDHYTRLTSQALQYPPKLLIKPHWLELSTISWKALQPKSNPGTCSWCSWLSS
jgi:hypothetical protein